MRSPLYSVQRHHDKNISDNPAVGQEHGHAAEADVARNALLYPSRLNLPNTVLFLKVTGCNAIGFRKTTNEVIIILKSTVLCRFVRGCSSKKPRCGMTHKNSTVILLNGITELLLKYLIQSMIAQIKYLFIVFCTKCIKHVVFDK